MSKFMERFRKKARKYKKKSCDICGATEKLTIDHIVPLAIKLNNSSKNLQTLCEKCHRKKDCNQFKRLKLTEEEKWNFIEENIEKHKNNLGALTFEAMNYAEEKIINELFENVFRIQEMTKKHRDSCKIYQKGYCYTCFGGGLRKIFNILGTPHEKENHVIRNLKKYQYTKAKIQEDDDK